MSMSEIDRYVDQHLEDSLAELAQLCASPSVSAQGAAIRETAALLGTMLSRRGFQVRLLEKPAGANPVLYAARRGRSPFTLLFYNHYDVQPPEPLELWSSPPFEVVRRDGKIYGRGVGDDKGDITARLLAIDALLGTSGDLPVSIKFCIEGDEEIGSPQLSAFVEKHRELLQANACIWEGGSVNWAGEPVIHLGVKGLIYVEFRVRSASRDVHSSYGTTVPNAAWRLTWALASIKGPDERIRVAGFYDDVRPPTDEERRAVEELPDEDDQALESLGLQAFVLGVRGAAYRMRNVFEPTATINGLSSGYQGPGSKTVLPGYAYAKADFRLVPDQDPTDIAAKLRRHLDGLGFADVEFELLGAERPARTKMTDPFVQTVRKVAEQASGTCARLVPNMAGTGPMYDFVETLGLPTACIGVGYPDTRAHAPDENIRVDDYVRNAKAVARLLETLGTANAP